MEIRSRLGEWPLLSLALAALFLILHLFPETFALLMFKRGAVLDGQVWLLLTGNFVHKTWEHMVRDSSAFLFFGAILEHRLRAVYFWYLIGASVAITTGYLLFLPGVSGYYGISGVVTGLCAILLLQELPRTWRRGSKIWFVLNGLLLAGLVGKVGYEFLFDSLLLYRGKLGAAPEAHVMGVVTGAVCWGLTLLFKMPQDRTIPWPSRIVSLAGILTWLGAVLFWPA